MVVPLAKFLRPHRLRHYIIIGDGRDELIKQGDKIFFYREGGAKGRTSLVALPYDAKGITSSHPLHRCKVEMHVRKPNIRLTNSYYKGIKNIQIIPTETETPKAKINPAEGKVWINTSFFERLPVLWQRYIIFHEVAHLWTHEEPDTDAWATWLYVRCGYPPSQAATCLKHTLWDGNPEKDERRRKAVLTALNNFKIKVSV